MLLRLLFLSLISTLFACGFHLKGATNLSSSLQRIILSESSDKVFNAELTKQLSAAGVILVNESNAAHLSVRFSSLPATVIAQSAATGLTIQQLTISVTYSVKNAEGLWLAQQKELVQRREFEENSDQLLAKNNEKEQAYLQMKRNLVGLLMYQLQRY